MASKQVQDLLVRLKIDGLEGLDSLKGAFRELAKTIGPTEQTIEKARQSIIEFGEAGNKSEQLIKGQIEAFKGLRSQATQGGKVYKELTADIKKLEGAAYGASPAVEAQRKALTALGLSADATASQIDQAINSLINLRGEVRVDSQAFDNFGKSIAQLTDRFRTVNQEAQNFAQAQQRIARPIGATSAAARQQIRDFDLVTESLREQRDFLGALEGEARIKSGVASLAERQVPAAGRRSFEDVLPLVLTGSDIKKLLPVKDIKAALDEVAREIADFQQQIETKLSRKIQISFQETARAGRESARAMAAAFSDPELINVFNQFDRRLGKLPNTTAGFEQELSELTVQLNNVERGSTRYVDVSNRIAEVQKELQKELTGTAEAFRRLDIAQAGVERRSEKLAGIQEYYRTQGPLAPGVGGYRDPATGAMIMAGARTPSRIRVEEAAYPAPIGPQPSAIPKVDRKAEIRDRIENYKQITAENAALREQAAIRRSIERARTKAAAGAMATVQEPSKATSVLFQNIAEIGLVGVKQQAELIGKNYSDVADSIQKVSAASNGSIQSLQAQRNAWQALRDRLDPTSKLFKQVSRDIEQVDRRLGKLQQTQSRRMTGMQMTQAAGAALSGGIFGGPEGFLGGAIGSAFGVGGAFAGAAIGAQIGGLRQQLGGFADYAAQIQKMKIALDNAAGSQDQFNQAMAAASAATRNMNVPQDVAIQGMTKLTAAVKGAGGQVSDAELVFNNVTAAIKATGGSAQDVDGAITAMVQVFSKGKVSAEELSGQLGERLPGAVTKFAKANDMTLPELQKALEQGQVGLNELMNFIVQLGDEYAGVAEKIAGSSQDAGARLTVAFNEMRIAIGEALQPVGAQFQEAFADFIRDITPGVVAAAKAVGDGIKFIINNASQIGAIVEFAAKLAGVTLALKALQVMQGPIGTLFLALQSGFRATSAQAVAAQAKIIAFGTAVKTVAASLAAPIVITFAIVGAELVIKWLERIKKARNELLDIQKQATGEQFLRDIGGSALTQSQLAKVASDVGKEYARASDNAIKLRKELERLEAVAAGPGSAALAAAPGIERVKAQLEREEAAVKLLEGRYKALVTRLPNAPERPSGVTPTEFLQLTGDGGSKAKSAADKAAREAQRRFDQELQNLVKLEDRLLKRLLLEDQIKIERSKQEAIEAGALDSAMQMQEIASRKLDLDVKQVALSEQQAKLEELRKRGLAQGLDVTKVADKMQENMLTDLELRLQREQLATQELKTQTDLRKEIQRLDRSLNQELQDRSYQLGLITEEQYNQLQIERERQRLEEQYRGLPDAQGRIDRGVDLFRREIDPTFAESLQTQIALVKRDLDELTKPINQVVGAASAIGDAFTESFTNVITGSTSAKQALSDFFKNVGKYFLDMAAQIIQRMIVLAILNQIVGLLPGGGGGPSGPAGPLQSGGDFNLPGTISTGILPAANGMAFAQNGIQPFANGGIVTKPTFFKYADGGTFSNGVMGEAGPEAIMPLKRGADGKLGVAARLDGAMKRYRPTPGSAAAIAEGGATAGGGAAGATMEPIDVRYSVERINNVDYVTADQFQRGMAQAAQQGAIQGERRAMRSLKNSSATRRGVGI